jgi:hypothetical protein
MGLSALASPDAKRTRRPPPAALDFVLDLERASFRAAAPNEPDSRRRLRWISCRTWSAPASGPQRQTNPTASVKRLYRVWG